MPRAYGLAGLLSMALLATTVAASEAAPLVLLGVRKISDRAPHSAFTDLIHYNGRFLCTFRESQGHASAGGIVRVLASRDGEDWTSVAVLTHPELDLRDPKLGRMPDGRLLMSGGTARYARDATGEDRKVETRSFCSFSTDGETWSAPAVVTQPDPDQWIWRVTWHNGTGYGTAYRHLHYMRVLRTSDGRNFEDLGPPLIREKAPSEATLRFAADGTVYCIVRREGERNAEQRFTRGAALFGVSQPPYDTWTWHDTGTYLGGPDFIQLPGGRWVVGARTRQGPARMSLLELDVTRGQFTLLLHLPSGGDCSYPGMVWHDGKLWVSYYSSHEGKGEIYLAQLELRASTETPAPPAKKPRRK